MARLSQPTSRLAATSRRLTESKRTDTGPTQSIRDNAPWHRLYNTARWRALRLSIFLRDLYTCQMCGKLEGNTSKLVCDHKRPHRGDERLFWLESNLQTLCADPCHNTHKQALEQESLHHRGVWD